MNNIFEKLINGYVATGELREDVYNFLVLNHCTEVAEHCMLVGKTCGELAHKFNMNKRDAEVAGYLHDISAVIPNNERIQVATQLNIDILPEEETFPMIIHQKISLVMAMEIFKIQNKDILEAIGCHTTLRKGSTKMDRLLFVADKISWDQSGDPPYLKQLMQQLDVSLDHAAFEYINYLWERRVSLKVLHPWLADAYHELKSRLHIDEFGE